MWRAGVFSSKRLSHSALYTQEVIAYAIRSKQKQKVRSSTYDLANRTFSTSIVLKNVDYEQKAKDLHEKGLGNEEDSSRQPNNTTVKVQEHQSRRPWHRERSDEPPVERMKNSSVMTKGKLLTTPSRLLKLILPVTPPGENTSRKAVEPLALLVHPQQPLSYLERLIQSELPLIKTKDGKDKIPEIHFKAEDSQQDEIATEDQEGNTETAEGSEEQVVDGKVLKLGKIERDSSKSRRKEIEGTLRGGPGQGGVESYGGQGREGSANHVSSGERKFIRWSASTEIGDFIRDAARGKEFAVEIEGNPEEIRVGVPSFNDRTHYLRIRLRKVARKLHDYASIKKECDDLAHKGAQRIALGGFGVLVSWWCAIYHFTFQTDYGWDTMEPITYLAGLSTIMFGYLWFLWHNREVSYRSALNVTVSRRQHQLYQLKGFDVATWDALVEEANALRKEIKKIAEEYDVEWDEKQDGASEQVHDALREERAKERKRNKDKDDAEEEEVDREGASNGKGRDRNGKKSG
ncbi:hypothetical protein F5884DRAFT_762238 [Xylogone sp. PMI_703]|nr:hypothetical protein F5884DRAFT_762238 [Xylogone sp. PMI_703]